MIKKIFTLLLVIATLHFVLYADWRVAISEYFRNEKDYKGAINYLLSHSGKADKMPNPTVSGLLAYSFNKINNKNDEYKWLEKYFEAYRGAEFIFNFLDDSTYADISDYLKTWKRKYPLITEIALIDSKIYKKTTPPTKLVIGIDIENAAYYKLSDNKNIIKGGLFNKGFNTLSIKAHNLFEHSGTHTYYLGLKADDLHLKKEIEINIQLDSSEIEKKIDDKIKNIEYKISMFIGNELIISSKKLHYDKLPMKFEMPPMPRNYDPFNPPDRTNPFKTDPFSNSLSIFSAVAGIYQLIKELKTKKNKEIRTPSIQKQYQITTTFIRKNAEGDEKEVKAVITLKTRNL